MMWRAWTRAAKRLRTLRGVKRKFPEPIKRWNIVRGDKVEVLSGKDKGKHGTIALVVRKLNKVYVEGLNTHIRVLPPFGEFEGARVASEAPLHYSNVALIDPVDNKPCRVKYMYTEEGEKVRVSRRSGKIIPKPVELLKERKDFKYRPGIAEGVKDTQAREVAKRTFVPSLLTFEEDVMARKKAEYAAETTPPVVPVQKPRSWWKWW